MHTFIPNINGIYHCSMLFLQNCLQTILQVQTLSKECDEKSQSDGDQTGRNLKPKYPEIRTSRSILRTKQISLDPGSLPGKHFHQQSRKTTQKKYLKLLFCCGKYRQLCGRALIFLSARALNFLRPSSVYQMPYSITLTYFMMQHANTICTLM